MFSAEQNSI